MDQEFPRRLRDLINAACCDALTDELLPVLEQELLVSAAAREKYFEAFQTVAAIRTWIKTDRVMQQALDAVEATVTVADRARRTPVLGWLSGRSGPSPRIAAITFLLIAMAFYGGFGLLMWTMTWGYQHPSELAAPGNVTPPHAVPPTAVARLDKTAALRFAASSTRFAIGDVLRSGDRFEISSGTAEVVFHDGARVVIEGPADFRVSSAARGRLDLGKLMARVPQQAVGFAMETPTATVIDLGTEFGLEVNRDGVAEVHVFEGAVIANFDADGDRRVQQVKLQKSEAARFEPHEPTYKTFVATPERFPKPAIPTAKSKPNIVHWNVAGPADWNTAGNWERGAVPGITESVGIKNGGTAVISSPTPKIADLGLGWNAQVERPTGFLQIVPGGTLTVARGNVDVGVKKSPNVSVLTVAGGSLTVVPGLDPGHLIIGDEPYSKGEVVLSSGSIVVTSSLFIGAGAGKLSIVGSRGTLVVGGDLILKPRADNGSGELALQIKESGITTIQVGGNAFLDDVTLSISLGGSPPATDLVLIDCAVGGAVSGTFADLPDESPVSATIGETTYHWLLSYDYDAPAGRDGSGNAVALKFVKISTAEVGASK